MPPEQELEGSLVLLGDEPLEQFAVRQAAKSFDVLLGNDFVYEGNETFDLMLSTPTGGATLGAATTATVTIVEDDPMPSPGQLQFDAASYPAGESGGPVTITVTRTSGSSGAVSVHYATGGGSASAGTDYTATLGNLNWLDGDVAAKTFTVSILNDWTYEGSETVSLVLSAPTGGASLGVTATTTLAIADDDPMPAMECPGMIVFESDQAGNRHIFRMNTDGTGVIQLTFDPPGQNYWDMIPEASEDGTKIVFASNRLNPGTNDYDIFIINSDGSGMQALTNGDDFQKYDPSISPNKRYVAYQGKNDIYMIDLQNLAAPAKILTSSDRIDSFAAWGADSRTLVYTTRFVVNNLNTEEIFLMKFDANMNVISNTQLAFDGSARDFYPDINYDGDQIAWTKLYATNSEIFFADLVLDGNGTYVLQNITNVTNTSTAFESVPYFSPEESDMISFYSNRDIPNPPPGTSPSEIYIMDLGTKAVIRLTNDTYRDLYPTWVEAPLLISVDNVSVVEDNPDVASGWTELVFTVSLARAVDDAYVVNYTTADGTAFAQSDYQPVTGSLTFDPGVTSMTITVQVKRDTVAEATKSFYLNLSKIDVEGEFAKWQRIGTILDDD